MEVIEGAKFRYVAVDIKRTFKLGSGQNAVVPTADVVTDLTLADPEDLLRKIERELGLKVENLVFIWLSPPCETNAGMERVNETKG